MDFYPKNYRGENMKISYILAILAIALMIGCAAPPEAPPETPPPEAPAEEVVEEVEAPPVGEITVTSAGFDPAELTVAVGTTLTITATEGNHKLTIGGKLAPQIDEGTSYDVVLEEAGETRLFDLLTKKSAVITIE